MVATFNPISADAAASDLAEYRLQIELEEDLRAQTEYYVGEGPVMLQPNMDPRWLGRTGLTAGQAPTDQQVEAFMSPIGPGGDALLPSNVEFAGYDVTFSAAKEVSARWAAETDPAKRAVYELAHRESVRDAMAWFETQMAWTRRGKGSTEQVEGSIRWMGFQHYSSRPTLDLGGSPDMPLKERLALSTKLPGDPGLHTHVYVGNSVLTADGHLGALDTMRMQGIVHELGAIYHARMAAHMADAGIAVSHDRHGIAAAVADTPEAVVDLLSKRGEEVRNSAQAYARSLGEDWDTLPASRRQALAAEAATITRAGKLDGKLNFDYWRSEIERIGVTLESAVGTTPAVDRSATARAERLAAAAEAAAITLGRAFETEAVITESAARTHCARALIPLGGGDVDDIAAVWTALQEQGVLLKEEPTRLVIGVEDGRTKITTQAQLDLEQEVVEHVRRASADNSNALTRAEIDQAIGELQTEAQQRGEKFQLTDEQMAALYHLASEGQITVAIGVAGAGKTTLLQPLVRALNNRTKAGDEHQVIGIATAWRQADALTGTGIPAESEEKPATEGGRGRSKRGGQPRDRRQREMLEAGKAAVQGLQEAGLDKRKIFATAALLNAYERGKLKVDSKTTILVDELSQLGVRDAVRLMRMQRETGCRIPGIGDKLQCQSVEAGAIMDLIDRAIPGQVPEIVTSQRQWRDRDKLIAKLFRDGQAAEALALKREDGTARLVAGGADETFRAAGQLWKEMRDRCRVETALNPDRPAWTFGMSAPSNVEARLASQAIRQVRRAEGEITGEDRSIECVDRSGETYDLQLAIGDRVRLFDRVYGRRVDTNGRPGRSPPVHVGNNGAIVQIKRFTDTGFVVDTAGGVEVVVDWSKIRDKQTGRIRLNAGDCLTIDSSQGATEHLWCNLLGNGTSVGAVNARRAYVAESRNRVQTYTLINRDAEETAIARARGIGSKAPITEEEIWEFAGKNLSKRTDKSSALAFAEAIGYAQAQAATLAQETRAEALAAHIGLDARERQIVEALRRQHEPAPLPIPEPAPRRQPTQAPTTAPARKAPARQRPPEFYDPVLAERADEVGFSTKAAGILRSALTRLREGAEAIRRTAARLADVTDLRNGVAAAERRIHGALQAAAARAAASELGRIMEEQEAQAPHPSVSATQTERLHDLPVQIEPEKDEPTSYTP